MDLSRFRQLIQELEQEHPVARDPSLAKRAAAKSNVSTLKHTGAFILYDLLSSLGLFLGLFLPATFLCACGLCLLS